MKLFVGRLPHRVSKHQLCKFIESGTRDKSPLGLLQKNKVMFGCQIIMMRNKDHEKIKYYGIVSHLPYKIAQRVIRNLDGKRLNGNIVTVRQYRDRTWITDRRQSLLDIKSGKVPERRTGDRRGHWTFTEIKEFLSAPGRSNELRRSVRNR